MGMGALCAISSESDFYGMPVRAWARTPVWSDTFVAMFLSQRSMIQAK